MRSLIALPFFFNVAGNFGKTQQGVLLIADGIGRIMTCAQNRDPSLRYRQPSPFKLPAAQGDFQVFAGTQIAFSFAIEETEVATNDLIDSGTLLPEAGALIQLMTVPSALSI